MNDRAVVAAQIDRSLRADVEVVTRCHLSLPVVVAVPPVLDDGTPFPTRYWLSCPLASRRVARLESAGGVSRLESFIDSDTELRRQLAETHRRYAEERDALIPSGSSPVPAGGVGGNQGDGLKCLHAHYADSAAGNGNPVGDIVRPFVEPLNCEDLCMQPRGDTVERNPAWREPR